MNEETNKQSTEPVLLGLLFLSIVIGFLVTAAILNSAITDSVEAFSVLAITLLGAIVGFAYLLKSARALDRMGPCDSDQHPRKARRPEY